MLFKNVSGFHVQLAEHRFLEPNGVVDFSEEEAKQPNIKHMVYVKNWLAPVGEAFATSFATAEGADLATRLNGGRVGAATTSVNINIPIGHEAEVTGNPDHDKIIEEALKKAEKQRGFNPMEDAYKGGDDEDDEERPYKAKPVNTKTEYGNAELAIETTPVVHLGGNEMDDPGKPANVQPVNYVPHHVEDGAGISSAPMPVPTPEEPSTEEKPKKAVAKKKKD